MTNQIIKIDEKYFLIRDDEKVELKIKKEGRPDKDGNTRYSVIIPKNLVDILNIGFIGTKIIDEKIAISGKYEFDDKSEKRTVNSSSWIDQMTKEEKEKYDECVNYINEIKKICMTRKNRPLTEREIILREIAKYERRLAKLEES